MITLRTDIDIEGNETDIWYVPDGGITIWHNGVDTGEPYVPIEIESALDAEQALALMVLCIADNDIEGAQEAAQMWKTAVGL